MPVPNNLSIFNFRRLPKAFLIAIGIIVMVKVVEVFVLPFNFLTFRVWEALSVRAYSDILPGPFYPNMKISMVEEGDLRPHTRFAVKKKVEWQTDRYGYRKADSPDPRYPIVVIGDSAIAGAGLTQEDMFSEVLERRSGRRVYPLAPATLNTLLESRRFQEWPPEVVIVASVEREIRYLPDIGMPAAPVSVEEISGFRKLGREILKRYPYGAVLLDHQSKNIIRGYMEARLSRWEQRIKESFETDAGGRSAEREAGAGEDIFFCQGAVANQDIPDREISNVIRILKGYRDALARRGIRFIFLPIPNKENIFYEYFPRKKRPTLIEKLITELRRQGVEVVDTQKAFSQAYREKNIMLYHTDDSHWNANGVRLAVFLLERQLRLKDDH